MIEISKTKNLEEEKYIKELYKHFINISYKCSINNVIMDDYVNVAHHAQIANSSLGKRSSIGRYCKIRDSIIGKYCSISWDVTIGAVSHPMERISSHAFSYRKQFGIVDEDIMLQHPNTVIGNDVWIGCNSVIKSGVSIGDGAVIGAGAVVTRDVLPYEIVVGVPARKLRNRFDDDIIYMLSKLKWWDKNDEWIKTHLYLFTDSVNKEEIKELIEE